MKRFIKAIYNVSEFLGQFAKYFLLLLMMIVFYEVISRYIFNNPTIWALESAKMALGTMVVLSFSYADLYGDHIRVDILYNKFSRRVKAWINVILSVAFLFPFLFVLCIGSIKKSIVAWKLGEKLVETSWLPPALPIRIVVTIGLIMFTIQSMPQFFKELYFLIKNEELII